MVRLTPFLVGLALLVGGGVVHGLWTDRWQSSEELATAAARLTGLPETVGAWKSEPLEQPADELQAAGAVGCWSRTFTDPQTGEKVLVILLAGKAARLVVHRPEHCYRSAGYELSSKPEHVRVPAGDGANAAEFWTGMFVRDEPTGPERMRIFWAWRPADAEGAWTAPDNPRLAFARRRALYKLYVIRPVGVGSTRLADDPTVRLLEQLVTPLDRALRR